jgi:lipopolysaccharide transport system ATP-binding protein
MSDLVIRSEGLSKQYRISGRRQRYKTLRESLADTAQRPFNHLQSLFQRRSLQAAEADTFWALRNASFEIKQGETVGIIGRNGAGKSTLLKLLSRITEPTSGKAYIEGRVAALLEVGTGFHLELTGRENIFLSGAILGMRRAEIKVNFDEIVAFAEVGKFIDTPVKHYSSGMYLRLAFAVAAHLNPEILLVDEVLAIGDVAFQNKCLGKMSDVAKGGRTVLFVSHNMGSIRSLCTRGILLNAGTVAETGEIGKVIGEYYKQVNTCQHLDTTTNNAKHSAGFGPLLLNGRYGHTLRQNESFQISTTLTIEEPINGFSLYCILEDIQNQTIFELREESTKFEWKASNTGKYAIQVTIPPLWLNPGLYSFCFKAMLWGSYRSSRYDSDKLLLDVNGTSSMVSAVLHPQIDWSFQQATPAAAFSAPESRWVTDNSS